MSDIISSGPVPFTIEPTTSTKWKLVKGPNGEGKLILEATTSDKPDEKYEVVVPVQKVPECKECQS